MKKKNIRIKKNYAQYKQIRIWENYIQYVQMYPLSYKKRNKKLRNTKREVRAVIVI